MENGIRLVYWGVGAILFAMALTVLMHLDKLLHLQYQNILYSQKYVEVQEGYSVFH